MPNTIQLEGGGWTRDEALATAVVIKPGYMVERLAAGTVQAHSTEGGYAEVGIAIEDYLQGKTKTDAYAVSTKIFFNIQRRGTRYQSILKAGETIVIGDELISDGAGRLIKNGSEASGTTVEQIIARATEALDLSGSGAVDTLLSVRAQ